MESSFSGLLFGLLGAVVLIYLLIVVNFQSWSDPFVIITALPAALAGIVWMLFTTQHHAVGAGADRRHHVHGRRHRQQRAGDQFRARTLSPSSATPIAAALEAGFVRIRPVMMTALAMIIGMLPMALGLGEGGEQNAPLGRAVIGGLVFATVATLMFVPVVFSMVHKKREDEAEAATPAARRLSPRGRVTARHTRTTIRPRKHHGWEYQVRSVETLRLRRRLAKLPFRQDHHRRRRRRLERIRRRLRLARASAPRSSGSRRAWSGRTRCSMSASMPSCSPRPAPRPAASIAQALGAIENALLDVKAKVLGRALLRTARRQDPRPHPGLLVALRDLAHQSSRLVQAGDHRSRRRQGDRPRGAREEIHRAEDQHLHLRPTASRRAGGPASACRSSPRSMSTARCCATCACISKPSATAPDPMSISCSTSISTPRPRAI